MKATQAKLITVRGRVQGVGFRYFVQNAATRLGLTGNVRNCPDSTVEIVAEGNARAIADLVAQVSQSMHQSRAVKGRSQRKLIMLLVQNCFNPTKDVVQPAALYAQSTAGRERQRHELAGMQQLVDGGARMIDARRAN